MEMEFVYSQWYFHDAHMNNSYVLDGNWVLEFVDKIGVLRRSVERKCCRMNTRNGDRVSRELILFVILTLY